MKPSWLHIKTFIPGWSENNFEHGESFLRRRKAALKREQREWLGFVGIQGNWLWLISEMIFMTQTLKRWRILLSFCAFNQSQLTWQYHRNASSIERQAVQATEMLLESFKASRWSEIFSFGRKPLAEFTNRCRNVQRKPQSSQILISKLNPGTESCYLCRH